MAEAENGRTSEMTTERARVIEAYRALMDEKGWSLKEGAKPVKIAPSTLSQVLAGTYKGRLGAICHRMSGVLHRERRRRAAPRRPGFKRTSVAETVLAACDDAHALRIPVLITGQSGCGRTEALKAYTSTNPETIHVVCGPHSLPRSILLEIADQVGIEVKRGGIHALRTALEKELSGSDRLLIVDEIDYVPESVLQSLRILADEADIGVVYCGTRAFLSNLRRRKSETVNQFLNRVAYVEDCAPLTDEDLDLLMEDAQLDEPARQVARENARGCARRMVNGIQLASRETRGSVGARDLHQAFRRLLAV